MNELILILLGWISTHTDYNTEISYPNVVMTVQHNMCANYGINNKSRCDDSHMQGFYNKKDTIYLRTDFEDSDPVDQSRLLHELIHYVQWKNDSHVNTCLGHLELEAYKLQDKWRKQIGLAPVLSDFNAIFLQASCET